MYKWITPIVLCRMWLFIYNPNSSLTKPIPAMVPCSWVRAIILWDIGRIRLSISTINRTYELSGITHVTPFRSCGKHSTGPCTYGPWVHTYSKLLYWKSVLTVFSYRAQSNEIDTKTRVSRGALPRVRRYGVLYLRTVEYDHSVCNHVILMWLLWW